jgi:hypothetical protein
MQNFLSRALVIAGVVLALASCGGGDSGSAFDNPPPPQGPGGQAPVNAARVTVTSSVAALSASGSETAEITAMVRDASNILIPGVPVTFTASSGGLAITQATTDASGQAKATLTTAGDSSLRTITVTASAGAGLSGTANVQVVAGGGGAVQMGSPAGATFQSGVIAVGNANVSAGGTSALTVVLQQASGAAYTQQTTVTFSSPCIQQNLATVGAPVQTTTGTATATYTAAGCSGPDQITATATVDSQSLSATGTLTVAPATIGGISFVSATPTNIALRGTGVPGNPETSVVIFRVLDSNQAPRPGATVTFALNTTVGGLALSTNSAVTGADGNVSTVVQGGTVATTVRVTATVTGSTPIMATQSSQLTVTTGIPDQDSFSLAISCPNVEAWNFDGQQTTLTARLADRFNNPVPNGTAVTFTTEGGRIGSQCVTSSSATESGVCSVTWTGSDPQTPDGRSAILATAIGEESFADTNGNGSFDVGENFTDQGERFLDIDESGSYTAGDPIYDFNINGTRDDVDGVFNGVLCNDPARCNTVRTSGIGKGNLVIMSDGAVASTNPTPGNLGSVGGINSIRTFFVAFADLNDNPLPQGSTVVATIAGNGFTLSGGASQTVPCSFIPTAHPFTVTTSGTASGSATLNVVVTSPRGIARTMTYQISL